MSVNTKRINQGYGIQNALQYLAPQPIPALRNPTVNDKSAFGTTWINTQTNSIFMLAGYQTGQAQWLNLAGGDGTFSSVVVDPGNVTVNVGDVNVLLGNITAFGIGSTITSNSSVNADSGAFANVTASTTEVTNSLILSPLINTVLVTNGAGEIIASNPVADGELLIGSNTGTPVWALPTSAGMTIDITSPGPGQLNFETAGAAGANTFVADDASEAHPLAGVIQFLGGTNVVTDAPGGNVVTIDLADDVSIVGSFTAGTTIACTGQLTAGTGLEVTTGNASITAGNLVLPNTSATTGQIQINGAPFAHAMGTSSTYVGTNAGNLGTPGSFNTFMGENAGALLNGSQACTGFGAGALASLVAGDGNTAVGNNALAALTGSNFNTAIGSSSLALLTAGASNIGIGASSLSSLLTGSFNIAVGYQAGSAYTGAESNNILIGNITGTVGDSNTIRIGDGTHTACYIGGIYLNTIGVTNAAVLVDNTGKLGTAVSSRRYKDNIKDLGSLGDKALKLRPVVFNYKASPEELSFGLIAEEVYEVLPQLVNLDDEGRPDNVKYHDLPAFLIDQVQKLLKRIDELEAKLYGK